MQTIWKYTLHLTPTQFIDVPNGIGEVEPLHVGVQNNDICLWTIVESHQPTCKIEIQCFETGRELPPDSRRKYIGTVILPSTEVYHFFWKYANTYTNP